MVQDGTENMGYGRVLTVSSGIKAVGFFIGLAYVFVDFKKLGKAITMTRAQREAAEAEVEEDERATHPLTKRSVYKPWTIYTLSALVAMVITGWTLFIKYLI